MPRRSRDRCIDHFICIRLYMLAIIEKLSMCPNIVNYVKKFIYSRKFECQTLEFTRKHRNCSHKRLTLYGFQEWLTATRY